jgi:UDP-GlcNAc:undecaprenyl-phosphate GlcNAc-1-phosphate transferase
MSFALTPFVRRIAFSVGAVDHPGPRKIHTIPTARLGGIAVVTAVTAILTIISVTTPRNAHVLPSEFLYAVLVALLPIIAISVIDDIRPQRAILKLGVHLLGASVAVGLGVRLNEAVHLFGREVHIGWLAIPLSILWLAGITNAFNLVDGLDGLSAGLALISAVGLTAVAIVTKRYEMAATSAVLAGALVGFLPYNTYPAKIYLGDTGATAIGFLLGALTLSGGSTTTAGVAVTLPIMIVGLPLADTVLSMIRRALRQMGGQVGSVMTADRDHIHHRLLAIGLNHQRAVLTLYLVAVALSIAGFASVFLKDREAAWLLTGIAAAAVIGVARLGYEEFAVVKRGVILRLYDAPVLKKGFFVVLFDLVMIAVALYVTTVLKYDDWGVRLHRDVLIGLGALLPPLTIATFALFRIYKRAWSTASVEDLVRSSAAIVASSAVGLFVAKISMAAPPRITFMLTYTLVMLVLINGSRASYRVLYHWNQKSNRDGEPIVIYGAGKGGVLALREIVSNSEIAMKPLGFIDDDPRKRGRYVNGYPVLGTVNDLERLCASHVIRGVVLATEKIEPQNLHLAAVAADKQRFWVRRLRVHFQMAKGITATVDEPLVALDESTSAGSSRG